MRALILSELERIWLRKRTWILLIIYMLLTVLDCVFVGFFGVGFYNPTTSIKLNSLNFSPFVIREIHVILMFVVGVMLFVDSFNYEKTIGAFRLVMIRPYKKSQYLISKWISLIITIFTFVLITFLINTIYGFIFLPKVQSTDIINMAGKFDIAAAMLFNIKFYISEFIILICLLSISSVISSIVPNAVLAALITIVACVGLVYVQDSFSFLVLSSQHIFDVLAHIAPKSLYISSIGLIIVGFTSSLLIWNKRDWLY